MSGYLEAKEDGIEIVKLGKYAEYTKYYVACSKCESKILTSKYDRNRKYKCDICQAKDRNAYKEIRSNAMFKRAKSKIMNILIFNCDLKKIYSKAFDELIDDISNGVRFDSAEEMMVAIELKRSNIPYELHKKVCGYELDFYLPDEKINIEIDGILYHAHRTEEDLERDNELKEYSDNDFVTVRILDVLIDYSVYKLMDKIHKALQNKDLYMIGNYITDDSYELLCCDYDK